jgi:hypothetical protein
MTSRSAVGAKLKTAVMVALALSSGAPAAAAAARAPTTNNGSRPLADSQPPQHPAGTASQAPSGQPLLSPRPAGEAEQDAQPTGPEPDPLVANGLGSPSCTSSIRAELPAGSRRDCETSGFLAAAAPTDNYGLDVHIDTGVLPLSGGGLLSTVQSLLITPEWLGLVWLVHAVVVMLEWCFAVDVIRAGSDGVRSGLAAAERSFTTPLLALALALAAVLTAYRGLVRREVAKTLGEAAVTAAMLGGGLWLMLDPAGTVGALSRWSDEATLGTLAVAAQGSPAVPGRTLGADLAGIFAATVEAPWCYLEFGDVAWCRESKRLEPTLRTAAGKIAADELVQAGCAGSRTACATGTTGAGLTASARLLREARTNGALFLALAPNGPARNSINERGSLLRALCRTAEATRCAGPGASAAEFRTNAGTWPRVTGLLLIAVGLLGMLLLYGYVAMRLLTAAVLGLFYLLLVPGAVLMPALGERGRELFRAWAARLFGAIVSKLVFAFLLGVLLAVTSVLEALGGLGWWAQWLLLSAFWWVVFMRRDQLLALPPTALAEARRRGAGRGLPGVRETLLLKRHTIDRRERRRERQRLAAGADVERSLDRRAARPSQSSGALSRTPAARPLRAQDQALRTLEVEEDASRGEAAVASAALARRAPRLAQIEQERRAASEAGDRRRATRLGVRHDRLATESAADEAVLARAADRPLHGRAGARQVAQREQFLDLQAELPTASMRTEPSLRRDYPALASLTRRSRSEYERLAPPAQRAARLEIDRELALRRPSSPPATAAERLAGTRRDERRRADPTIVRRRTRPPVPPARTSPSSERLRPESPMLSDARQVAEGRKRQLGIGRP